MELYTKRCVRQWICDTDLRSIVLDIKLGLIDQGSPSVHLGFN